ncbi:MAG: hypothetical protein ABSC56_09095 [Solirubrobacteraceae bacterium]|jgi:hypothetical protein
MLLRKHRRTARPLGYANVAATLALVIAAGGGTAWAAHHFHYLITSEKQIKPSVLRALHGATGATGATGAIGAAGASGATGSAGSNLTAETVLPSGQSESGVFAANGSLTSDSMAVAIDYTQPLASAITAGNIVETASTTTDCPGQGHAARGYLCIYDLESSAAAWDGTIGSYGSLPSPDPGALVYFDASGNDAYVFGTWTVTAP